MRALNKPIEVVFVSGDRDEPSFKNYYATEMPWLAVPFDSDRKDELMAEHKIRGFPTLKIIDDTGRVIDEDAMQRPLNAATVDSWVAKAGFL